MAKLKLAVLISGTGSLLEAMPASGVVPDLVVADRHCRGIDEVAAKMGTERVLVLRKDFGPSFDRLRYTVRLLNVLMDSDIDVVAMAGFMTILHPIIFERYEGLALNTHPSLLPAFKGAHAVRDALAAGVTETGCTIHIATAELDDGPILAQGRVRVLPRDTETSLHGRIKAVERTLYPVTIRMFMQHLPID